MEKGVLPAVKCFNIGPDLNATSLTLRGVDMTI